jgi:hypothetical protein
MGLASDAQSSRDAARSWFLEQGALAIPLLEEGLADERLGLMAHRQILPVIRAALHRALDRDDPIVRSGAMEALAAFDTPESFGELVALLDHPNADVAKLAVILVDHVRTRGRK